ncbi:FtsX-like permease family protein [Streptomyces sp. NPDC005921]
MRELMLGLRLLFGGGRGNRVRFALMTLGSSMGACCLAIMLTIPGILAVQDGRVAARQPDSPHSGATAGLPLWLERADPYGSHVLTRVFMARGTTAVVPPPGLKAIPGPGEVFVSPSLRELLGREPGLAHRLPGREAGLIGPQGLARPDELVAYVGTDRDDLPDGRRAAGFGHDSAPPPALDPSALDSLRFTMACVVLLPLVVYLSVCARLSAAERARRLAALRLIGMSIQEVQRVNAAETVAAAGLGAVLGLGEFWVLNQLAARVGLPGFTWYPGDGALSASTLVACLVGCPVLAWFVGRASARKAAANPLAVRRAAVEKAPSPWGFLPLLAGSGIAVGYCVAGATGHVPDGSFLPALLIPSSALLIGFGLVAALPSVSRFFARRLARSTRSLALSLAMRRNEAEPGSVLRVSAGLVLLVFVTSLAQGVLIQFDESIRNSSPLQSYDMPYEQLTAGQRQSVEQLPGVRGHVITLQASLVGASEWAEAPDVVVATCAQLRAVVAWVGDCADGQPIRLWDGDGYTGGPDFAGRKILLSSKTGQRSAPLTVPKRVVRYRALDSIGLGIQPVLVPPSMLPTDARPGWGRYVLVSASDPDTVRQVLDGIGRIGPTIEVTPEGVSPTDFQEFAVVRTLLTVGMVLGLVIAVAAFVVAATDRAVERRSQVTALSLLGARPRTLRAVQVTQVVLPLTVGLVLAVVVGRVAESGYLVYCQGATFWDDAGLPVLLVGTLAVIVVAALGALPLVGRRIDPELIRRD